MPRPFQRSIPFVVLLSLTVAVTSAYADSRSHARSLGRMMTAMAAQSAKDAATIRRLYRPHLTLLRLNQFDDLAGALATGGLAPLPADRARYNLLARLDGPHPIGEKDLVNQANYLAARPATIGALIIVASRVRSGPVEITSLVRHAEYQADLMVTNANASTSVPMHTMGLAFDIALVNTPLKRVQELRRVLQQMRAAGDILFIGERQQLVFHVVPHPSRLGYFTDIYMQAVGAVSAAQAVEVVAPGPPRILPARLTPRVTTDIVAIATLPGEWNRDVARVAGHVNAGDGATNDAAAATAPLAAMVLLRGVLAFIVALMASVCRIVHRSRAFGEA
jgi:hypothetical protein